MARSRGADRDDEFVDSFTARDELTAYWKSGWQRLFDSLDSLSAADLCKTVTIRGEPHSVRARARPLVGPLWIPRRPDRFDCPNSRRRQLDDDHDPSWGLRQLQSTSLGVRFVSVGGKDAREQVNVARQVGPSADGHVTQAPLWHATDLAAGKRLGRDKFVRHKAFAANGLRPVVVRSADCRVRLVPYRLRGE